MVITNICLCTLSLLYSTIQFLEIFCELQNNPILYRIDNNRKACIYFDYLRKVLRYQSGNQNAVNRFRTNNNTWIRKKKGQKQTMIYKTLHRNLKIDQHKTYWKSVVFRKGRQFLLHNWHPSCYILDSRMYSTFYRLLISFEYMYVLGSSW
jgi:hypothetical protein